MAYVLQPGDPIPAELHRVMREQLDRMRRTCAGVKSTKCGSGIKETRRCCA